MNDSFGKFILGIATSVSLTAITCLISKTTQDNKNSYDNDVMYTPPYRRIYFEKGQITTNERVLPAYKEDKKYKFENQTLTGDVIKDEIYDSWFYT